ncbi:MAG: tRNA preQ1(34) S-adenosylmethionine ribosyltransferase-isomerase QueA [Gemmatimonadota bacterium]
MSRRSEERYTTSAFDYELPRDRIARYPAARRDESKLMVLDRARAAIEHRRFRDLIEYFEAGDALVLNETKVFPARLLGTRASGAEAEVLLLTPETATDTEAEAETKTWRALVRPGAKLKPGKRVFISDDLSVEIIDSTPDGGRIVRLHTSLPVPEALQRYGRMPLPPYIDRDADATDRERYQTVYARAHGSVAAPTAGLHFTQEMLERIAAKGVAVVRIVLHVGVGTFRPVDVEEPAAHVMHSEYYQVSDPAVQAIRTVQARKGKVWAVGTTVVRTLESIADVDGNVRSGSGSTALFIRPGYQFKVVDRLITNFHLPRSTLLMLVAAFGGYDLVMRAYRVAIESDYRFYSYGDAMVLL